LEKFANPLYLSAIFYWVLGKIFRVQVHKVLKINSPPIPCHASEPPFGFDLLALREPSSLAGLHPSLEAQLNEESGVGCRTIVQGGDRIYAFVDRSTKRVACQLNLRRGVILVDSPTDLILCLRNDSLFLNYLHTRPDYRGHGLATHLIQLAWADAASGEANHCFAHVRSTNVASLGAFRRSGWFEIGRILTTRSGRFISAPGCAVSGLRVRPITAAAANV